MPVSLKLGDFTFNGTFECPQVIPGGGRQSIALHDLIGGVRIADAMGSFDNDIGWNGTFIGITAEDRAKELNQMRNDGKPLVLSYSSFQFLVLINSFTWNFKPNYFIDYNISLTVIEDQTQPLTFNVPSAFNDTILVDLAEALTIAELLKYPSITSALALLNAAISNVPDLGAATEGALAGISAAIQDALNAVNQITGVATNFSFKSTLNAQTASHISALDIAQGIEDLEKLWNDYTNSYELQNVLTRMQRNIQIQMSPTGTSLTISNRTLFQVAVEQYGDFLQWTALAEANIPVIRNTDGFPDPYLTGIKTILVPPASSDKSTGIMRYAE